MLFYVSTQHFHHPATSASASASASTSTSTSTSTSAVPVKRSSSPHSSTTPTATGVGAVPVVPAMKKAKSQAVACSLDGNKNGQQQITPHVHFAETPVHSPMMEDDPSDVVMEASPSSTVFGRGVSASGGGVTANLSRKKATPPQPTKKLESAFQPNNAHSSWTMPVSLDRVTSLFDNQNSCAAKCRLAEPVWVECGLMLVFHTDALPCVPAAKPTLPSNFEENTWATLKSAINAIFLKQPDPCDLEKLYQAVNDLCLHKMGGSLYQRIEKDCGEFISAALQTLVGQSEDLAVFLSLVEKCWQDFCDQMLMIRGIALYLDRTYVKQTPNVRSLWDMGLQLFRKHLSLASEVEHKTVFGLLKMIESESFEKPFLEATSEFYAAEGTKYMQQSDVPDYLKHVEIRLQEEHERCLLYLDASTRKPLVATAERQLLVRHISAILDKGFMILMDAKRIEDLQRLYLLFSRVNALESLRQSLSQYIRRTGQGIVMDEEKDKDMVSSLLEFKANLDRIWEESFSKNEAFGNTIKDAFEHLINIRQNRPAELIAKFVDEKLRSGNKGASEEELEGTLDRVLVLFRFIQGKDVFEAFYKKDLAKRLLLGKSASIDAEKSMITKLKTECGSQFTNKLEGMFKVGVAVVEMLFFFAPGFFCYRFPIITSEDIELSKEINESFKQSSQARTKLPSGIEMSVTYWPTYPPMDVRLPHELNVYQEFYLSKYSGRRLMWQNSLGHCVLKAEFPKGKKELAVSLFQTVVLMLFNDAQKLSFQDIKESTGIEDKELRRTLQSLACGKFRVLQKIPKGRDVEDEDSFMFNDQFTAPLYRLKVNAIQMKETVEENTSTTERVFQDRQYQVDAAIVRIMKTRKVLSHTLLITELFQQLKFPIKPADLKKRIESLIDREYLERDKNNPQIYNYLA
ncbi:Cullin-4 [Sesamum angolense]|uniref:Cullin-4 n=1 Tax=Sesamum angolense TaxID=2727404 RepID=A0AAE2BVH6_9LAMI|nr:Cullin-4 [Sesamum angolense]